MVEERCPCGEEDCEYVAYGYPWCPHCQDHHRPWPNCPGITQDGEQAEGEVMLYEMEE